MFVFSTSVTKKLAISSKHYLECIFYCRSWHNGKPFSVTKIYIYFNLATCSKILIKIIPKLRLCLKNIFCFFFVGSSFIENPIFAPKIGKTCKFAVTIIIMGCCLFGKNISGKKYLSLHKNDTSLYSNVHLGGIHKKSIS